MKKIILIFLVLLLVGCGREKTSTVHINYSNYPNLPLIDVFINDEGPFKFLIDTGASTSQIKEDDLEKMHLKKSPDSRTIFYVNERNEKALTQTTQLTFSNTKAVRNIRFIIEGDDKLGPLIDGVLGVDALIGASLKNVPSEGMLELTLPDKAYECDVMLETSNCYNLTSKMPYIPSRLGGVGLKLLLDTGNLSYKSILLTQSDLNTEIWKKYRHYSPSDSIDYISDKPVTFLKTHNFVFNGNKSCYADFIIRDPNDSSVYYSEPTALLGWTTAEKAAFEIHFLEKTTVSYPKESCPFGKLNNLGIGSFSTTDEREYVFAELIEIGSPAHRAGIKNGDKIERIHLESGEIIERFEDNFYKHPEKHVYAPDGTYLKFDILRDGKIIQLTAQTHKPFFIDTHKPFIIEPAIP